MSILWKVGLGSHELMLILWVDKDARKLASEAVEETRKVGEDGDVRSAEVEILDMKGLEGDMKDLELELERGSVNFWLEELPLEKEKKFRLLLNRDPTL